MRDPTSFDISTDPTTRRLSGVTMHGDKSFNVPYISQIGENLWQGGCQDGMVLPSFIKHLVSLYPWESYTAVHDLDSLLIVRMYDSEGQEFDQVDAIAAWVTTCIEDGPTLVHCQAGLNRSSLITARVLMSWHGGMMGSEAVQWIREKRSDACLCNPAFERWLTKDG